ncbi:UNVERIFIED_CONTAM: hypothetical protein Sangu_3159700 [Sesamum angustifolium]|uniref:Uncharacterized protein n=1 Tax=Sesamum angustifolium TaxID=2727405 RepID=A0AAW2JU52_9LAMI
MAALQLTQEWDGSGPPASSLILDAVHWNPEAPPRTLPRVRLRCDVSFSPRSMKKGDVSGFFRRTGSEALCRGGGREKKRLRRNKLGFPMLLHARCANLGIYS